tara:strand:- start:69127 stop:69489 length:363 start_codon:yes stop_codon:yes gene_type:complete
MDTITLTGLSFHGHHGCLEEEKQNGQTFTIDLELQADLSKACQSDALEDTLNYAEIFETVKTIVTQERFNLIERLGEVICQTLLSNFNQLNSITIRVKKPEAPLEGTFDYSSIQLTRTRT